MGSTLQVFDVSTDMWINGRITKTANEMVTIMYVVNDEEVESTHSRFSDQIKLFRDKKTKLYLPLPETVETKSVTPEKNNKDNKRKKKKKKKTAAKLQTEDELIEY